MLAALTALAVAWPAAAEESYQLSARAHPAFRVAVTINGAAVATISPTHGGAASVTASVAPDRLRPGENELRVIYNVVAATRDEGATNAFVVALRRTGPADAGNALVVEILGPLPPFPDPGGGGRITRRFTVKP